MVVVVVVVVVVVGGGWWWWWLAAVRKSYDLSFLTVIKQWSPVITVEITVAVLIDPELCTLSDSRIKDCRINIVFASGIPPRQAKLPRCLVGAVMPMPQNVSS